VKALLTENEIKTLRGLGWTSSIDNLHAYSTKKGMNLFAFIATKIPNSSIAMKALATDTIIESNKKPGAIFQLLMNHHRDLTKIKPWSDAILDNNLRISKNRFDDNRLNIMEEAFICGNVEAFVYLWHHSKKISGINANFNISKINKEAMYQNKNVSLSFVNNVVNKNCMFLNNVIPGHQLTFFNIIMLESHPCVRFNRSFPVNSNVKQPCCSWTSSRFTDPLTRTDFLVELT